MTRRHVFLNFHRDKGHALWVPSFAWAADLKYHRLGWNSSCHVVVAGSLRLRLQAAWLPFEGWESPWVPCFLPKVFLGVAWLWLSLACSCSGPCLPCCPAALMAPPCVPVPKLALFLRTSVTLHTGPPSGSTDMTSSIIISTAMLYPEPTISCMAQVWDFPLDIFVGRCGSEYSSRFLGGITKGVKAEVRESIFHIGLHLWLWLLPSISVYINLADQGLEGQKEEAGQVQLRWEE